MTKRSNIHANVQTSFVPHSVEPSIDETAFVHHMGVVIGAVTLGRRVFVGPFASVRADEGIPIHVGDDSNVQDGVVIHGLETFEPGREITRNLHQIGGRNYSVYVGRRVSLAHQCHVHGPAVVQDDSFVGMQALVLMSVVGKGCVIEPGAKVIGVQIPDARYVPANAVIRSQEEADNLGAVTRDYPFCNLNQAVVHVNVQLAQGYRNADL